ncbi:transmembrane channel-like protein 7 isoform X1 [Puntigrus tetrazona]|uniref:transmembrane channel-like protein 7 isoform X1 n=1 Tax=Puntigrus tetrazona TaxID=1606681 RepID=UPI001C892A31|nr:transmembrane channel-like protein 7 isoform X1 [Puntigrus tetrazona]
MDASDAVFLPDRRAPASHLLLEQLPSYQSLLYRRKSSASGSTRRRGSGRGRQPSINSGKWVEQKSVHGGEVLKPVRELPKSMQDKRQEKQQRLQQGGALSGWGLWRLNVHRSLKRLKEDGMDVLSSLQLWRADIHLIEGMFGTGILSYFSFLRFLVLLNFIMFVLMFAFVMLPVIVTSYSTHNVTYSSSNVSECSEYRLASHRGLVVFHQHISDLLSGTGFLEHTYLFYGYYKLEFIYSRFTYNLPLAYLLATISYLLLSLVWIVKRSAAGFKRKLIQDEDRFQSFCNKVFAGWDFCITNENAARLKRSSLLYELKTDLEEERIKRKMANRTRGEKCRIYALRAVLNLFVMAVLVACFYCIYIATVFSQRKQAEDEKSNFLLELVVEYLPSIVITLANFITPLIFNLIIAFEDYSPAFEIRFTLMRCVFMRLASIGVLLFSLWYQITSCGRSECPCGYNHWLYPCWETHVGQEMYKLVIFDFLIIAAVTIFVEFPRKIIVNYCDCGLAKWWGQQEFAVPQNVLEIVYGQTICWIGTFYCPLLPAINTVKYILVFYLKKVSLVTNCRPATRPFRASSSHFFFLVVLLIGLALACVPVVVSIAEIRSSRACGPFVGYSTSWEVVPRVISQLPRGLRLFLQALATEAFAVSFFVITCLGMFYVIALAGAHKRVIEQLRDQLAMEGRDKRFLIQKLCQAQQALNTRSPQGFRGRRRDTELYFVEPSVVLETQA